ncbi:MAG: 16S rRNA (guanine(527)-N(7))-methyltransferase RsmG [Bacillota bacterium]|jgi:16S rRNA (guanine527-N7)-methyltransferase|nr:16S rRNA (guanine(527)-N(7))-methyltransferase RsmG [Bacillota bacterium]NLJ02133.1 16S rRNA (guanine(527)-N(7))-methyltransferase RsmG [Bacillota bacterium]
MNFDAKRFEQVLLQGLQEWGLEECAVHLPSFTRFSESVVETNQTLNLTRLIEPEEMAVKNFLDSLGLLCLDWPEKMRCLDLGTGAGFPGVPLAICRPQWSFVLLDSLRKRLRFIEGALESMGVENVSILHARAEDAGRDQSHRESYDLVVSRAVARLPVLLELATPLVKVGGCFVAYKSNEGREELQESSAAMRKLNVETERVFDLELPLAMGERSLIVFRKLSPTPSAYPRRAGLPNKQPLG